MVFSIPIWFVVNLIAYSECKQSLTTVSGTYAPKEKLKPGVLIFEEEFNTLDLKKWQHELSLAGGSNWEFQQYCNNRSNSYVKDGVLHIRPTLLVDEVGEDFLYSGTINIDGGAPAERCTNPRNYGCSRTGFKQYVLNPIKSARLHTVDTFAFKYGTVEVRAKVPIGDWLWPGAWLMPRWNQYSSWPASGEIDLMESRGNKDLVSSEGVNIGVEQVQSTLHWGPDYKHHIWSKTYYPKNLKGGFNTDFHKFKLVWDPDCLKFFVDDEEIGNVTVPEGGFWEFGGFNSSGLENPWIGGTRLAPFDQEFYLILNLAVGGIAYFPDNVNNPGGKPWNNLSPHALTDFWKGKDQWLPTWNMKNDDTHFQVDYVRVWAL